MSAGSIGRRTFVLGSLSLPALARAASSPPARPPLKIGGSASVCRLVQRALTSPKIPHDLCPRLSQAVFDGTSDAVTVAKLSLPDPPSLVLLDGPTIIKAQKAGLLTMLPAGSTDGINAKLKNAVQGGGAWFNYVRPWYAMAWSAEDPKRPDGTFAPWQTDGTLDERMLLLPPFSEATAPYLLWTAARAKTPDVALSDVIQNPADAFAAIAGLERSGVSFDMTDDAMLDRLAGHAQVVAAGLPSSRIVPAMKAGGRETLFPLTEQIGRTAVPFGIAMTSKAPAVAAAKDFLAALVAPEVQAALYTTFHEPPRRISSCKHPRACGDPPCPDETAKPKLSPNFVPPPPLPPVPEPALTIPDWGAVASKFDDWSARWTDACRSGCSQQRRLTPP